MHTQKPQEEGQWITKIFEPAAKDSLLSIVSIKADLRIHDDHCYHYHRKGVKRYGQVF